MQPRSKVLVPDDLRTYLLVVPYTVYTGFRSFPTWLASSMAKALPSPEEQPVTTATLAIPFCLSNPSTCFCIRLCMGTACSPQSTAQNERRVAKRPFVSKKLRFEFKSCYYAGSWKTTESNIQFEDQIVIFERSNLSSENVWVLL